MFYNNEYLIQLFKNTNKLSDLTFRVSNNYYIKQITLNKWATHLNSKKVLQYGRLMVGNQSNQSQHILSTTGICPFVMLFRSNWCQRKQTSLGKELHGFCTKCMQTHSHLTSIYNHLSLVKSIPSCWNNQHFPLERMDFTDSDWMYLPKKIKTRNACKQRDWKVTCS